MATQQPKTDPDGPRTYHDDKDSKYLLPNDAPEHDRLDVQAKVISDVMNGEVLHSPVNDKSVKRVLDIGCGTGAVTDHMGSRFPGADVYGLDLSAVPSRQRRPPNVRFLQGNFISGKPEGWRPAETLPASAHFDLIFSRLLVLGMTGWPKFIRTKFDLLNPGGWAEVHDIDVVAYDGQDRDLSQGWEWWQPVRAASEESGLDFRCGSRAETWMKDAGFVDVRVTCHRFPFGAAGESTAERRALGDYMASAVPTIFHHTITKSMEARGHSATEIDRVCEDNRRDNAPADGRHFRFYVTVGRKPERT